jgi:formylglycine-generating enzyme required for sulfatase activity
MKAVRPSFYLLVSLSILLAACAPVSTPAGGEPPVPGSSSEAAPTPTALSPVNVLAGPPMEIGSRYPSVDGNTWLAVPAGQFVMGHGGPDNPVHNVTLSDYWIQAGKVTNRMFRFCEGVGQCTQPSLRDNPGYTDPYRSNEPVVGVDYAQAEAYCKFIGGRLPTEAEYEKAASWDALHNAQRIYPWGDAKPSCDLLNGNNCVGKPTDVTLYQQGQSPYFVLDMSGNVFEWVADWYKPDYYLSSELQDPLGPNSGTNRSVRSSAFDSGNNQAASANRFYSRPGDHRDNLGFRCVTEDPTKFAPFCEQIAVYGDGPAGGGQGGIPGLQCPSVDVSEQPQDCGEQTSGHTPTIVTFQSSDPGAVPQGMGGCTQLNPPFPAKYSCNNPANAYIKAYCTYSDPGPAHCAAHYNLNTGTGVCEWDGSGATGGECPPGYVIDDVNHCCTVGPGSGIDYPLCPAGYSPVEGPPGAFKCLPGDDPGHVEDGLSVSFQQCFPGGGGCPPPPGGCGVNYAWDPSICACVCNGC